MARKEKRQKVRRLVEEAQIDPEDALIRLWDASFESVIDIDSEITGTDVKRAQKLLGIPTNNQLRSVHYWMKVFGLDRQQFEELLVTLDIRIGPITRVLPSGSVRKLKSEARRRNPNLPLPRSPVTEREKPITPPQDNARGATAPLVWYTVGHEQEVRYLTAEEVLKVHYALVNEFAQHDDPIDPPGVRDPGLLESAVFRPQTSNGSVRKYPTVEMSAAALLHSLVHNHPFHNGNKRTALVSTLVFLDENGFIATCQEDKLFQFLLRVAQHSIVDCKSSDLPDREALEISRWIASNARVTTQGERPLPFRKLKRILARYNCQMEFGASGSKMNITRVVPRRHKSSRSARDEKLQTQVNYHGDGREVERNTMNKIRTDLELDEEHGVDSGAFYNDESTSADDFIVMYSKTLRRLSGV